MRIKKILSLIIFLYIEDRKDKIMNVEIRRLSKEDIRKYEKNIKEYIEETYKISFPANNIEGKTIENKFNMLLDNLEKDNTYIAGIFCENNIAGYIWSFYREYLGEWIGHLDQIFVEPSYRGQGLSKLLIKEMEKFMKNKKILKIDLNVSLELKNTLNLYETLGYKAERCQMIKVIQSL